MAKKFVRCITDVKTINKQDFDTNNVNDLLSDGEHNYIHRKKKDKSEEYHNLTDNIKTISSDNTNLLTVTNKNKTTNSATLHPKHDAQKEQVLESTRNTITINHGTNGNDETTKVDTNPQKVLEHKNLTSNTDYVKVEHASGEETTLINSEAVSQKFSVVDTNLDTKENKLRSLTNTLMLVPQTEHGETLIDVNASKVALLDNIHGGENVRVNKSGNVVTISSSGGTSNIELHVGSGQPYSTIQQALNAVNNSSKNKVYDIVCHPGNHYFSMINNKLPDYVNIKGSTGNYEDVVIIGEVADSADDYTISQTATFNVSKNNNFENVTITGKNMRYVIHDESSGKDKDCTQIVKNCRIVHYGNKGAVDYRTEKGEPTSGIWKVTRSWGEGASSGAKSYYDNVIFESPVQPYYCHEPNDKNSPQPYFKQFNNCVFKTTKDEYAGFGGGVTIDNNNQRTLSKNVIIFNNCSFERGKIQINGDVPIDVRIHGSNQTPIQVANLVNYPKTDNTMLFYYAGEESLTGFEKLTINQSKGYEYVVKATASTPANEIVGINVTGPVSKGQTVMTSNDKFIFNRNQLIIN